MQKITQWSAINEILTQGPYNNYVIMRLISTDNTVYAEISVMMSLEWGHTLSQVYLVL